MAKKLETPYPANKRGIPLEFKYDYVLGMVTTLLKGFLYEIRERYGGAIALDIYEMFNKKYDRVNNMIKFIKNVFKIEGNDIEAIMSVLEIFYELTGVEATWLEVTKTHTRIKITKCPWSKPDPEDINDWERIFLTLLSKAVNPKVTVERPKAMCAGDPYCEYVWKLRE